MATVGPDGRNRLDQLARQVHNRMLHTPTAKANQAAPSMRDRDPGSWFWPTPTAWLGRRPAHATGDPARYFNPERSNDLSDAVAIQTGGSLNPMWVEWLMGFPEGWTDLEDSETP